MAVPASVTVCCPVTSVFCSEPTWVDSVPPAMIWLLSLNSVPASIRMAPAEVILPGSEPVMTVAVVVRSYSYLCQLS